MFEKITFRIAGEPAFKCTGTTPQEGEYVTIEDTHQGRGVTFRVDGPPHRMYSNATNPASIARQMRGDVFDVDAGSVYVDLVEVPPTTE